VGTIVEVLLTVIVQGALQALLASGMPNAQALHGSVRQNGLTPGESARRRSPRRMNPSPPGVGSRRRALGARSGAADGAPSR
jgi:hypothetical protein